MSKFYIFKNTVLLTGKNYIWIRHTYFIKIFIIYENNNLIYLQNSGPASSHFRKRFCDFLSNASLKWITPNLIKNLKFLLDAQISGDNLSFLFDAGMEIKDAASDPRYLHSIAALVGVGVTADVIIPLMRAKVTIYRLFGSGRNFYLKCFFLFRKFQLFLNIFFFQNSFF